MVLASDGWPGLGQLKSGRVIWATDDRRARNPLGLSGSSSRSIRVAQYTHTPTPPATGRLYIHPYTHRESLYLYRLLRQTLGSRCLLSNLRGREHLVLHPPERLQEQERSPQSVPTPPASCGSLQKPSGKHTTPTPAGLIQAACCPAQYRHEHNEQRVGRPDQNPDRFGTPGGLSIGSSCTGGRVYRPCYPPLDHPQKGASFPTVSWHMWLPAPELLDVVRARWDVNQSQRT